MRQYLGTGLGKTKCKRPRAAGEAKRCTNSEPKRLKTRSSRATTQAATTTPVAAVACLGGQGLPVCCFGRWRHCPAGGQAGAQPHQRLGCSHACLSERAVFVPSRCLGSAPGAGGLEEDQGGWGAGMRAQDVWQPHAGFGRPCHMQGRQQLRLGTLRAGKQEGEVGELVMFAKTSHVTLRAHPNPAANQNSS